MKQIFLGVVGSRGYGVHFSDSDWDRMGICLDPVEAVLGLGTFEQHSPKEKDGQTTIYGLKKFLRLILKGTPNATELLWTPNKVVCDPYTSELMALRKSLVSKQTLKCYAAYMRGQIHKLQNGRGQAGKTRPELVAKYGYDTKFAYHIIRLGLMGQVLGQTGRVYMPLDPGHVSIVMNVREGRWNLDRLMQSATTMLQGVEHYILHSDLPDQGDWKAAEDWVMGVYRREYGNKTV